MSCELEKIRLRNIEDNKRILAELGLLNPFKPLPRVIKKRVKVKRKRSPSPVQEPIKRVATEDDAGDSKQEEYGYVRSGSVRRSSRTRGKAAPRYSDMDQGIEDEEDEEGGGGRRRNWSMKVTLARQEKVTRVIPKVAPNRPNFYGAVPDVEIGTLWATRIECCAAGVQRPTVAGIHSGPEGAYSIALSGGYEDDIDMGDCFTYTGEGGRDLSGTSAKPKNLRTAPQSKDQPLSRGNLALVKSVETGNPVRVIRGYKLPSPFAPEEGYRYDGLYKVEKWWYTIGLSGFHVYKFALRRLNDQAAPPWTLENRENGNTQTELEDLKNNSDTEDLLENGVADKLEDSSDLSETPSSSPGDKTDDTVLQEANAVRSKQSDSEVERVESSCNGTNSKDPVDNANNREEDSSSEESKESKSANEDSIHHDNDADETSLSTKTNDKVEDSGQLNGESKLNLEKESSEDKAENVDKEEVCHTDSNANKVTNKDSINKMAKESTETEQQVAVKETNGVSI